MSDGVQLLIPFAFSTQPGCARMLTGLALPQLERLLARLAPQAPDEGDETTFSTPHERVLARACGLADGDGATPWAAWQLRQEDRDPQQEAWAWITPCHWRVATDHITMAHPRLLEMDAQESQALLAAMQPFFQHDGIALEYDAPTRWLARGEVFRDLATASLDRVVGRTIDEWMPRAPQARLLRRLQQEMQMLLYTHEINEARSRAGLLPVNSFWVSGTGALPPTAAAAPPAGLRLTHYLRDAALNDDWNGWASAWQQLDAKECARLAADLDAGRDVTLTLCGERRAQSWSSRATSPWSRRLRSVFTRPRAAAVLETL